MDSKDTPDSQDEGKQKTLPTYVFGDDYKQTVNLAKDDNKDDTKEPETPVEDPKDDETTSKDEIHDDAIEASVSAELKKIELEKPQPVAMIVTKKRFRLKFLFFIFFASAIAFVVVYGLSILSDRGVIGGKNSIHIASGFSTEKVICELGSDSSGLLGAGNAIELSSSVEVSYSNNEFKDLTQTIKARFEDSSTAKIAMSNVRSKYVKRFKSFGVETEPFKSDYNQNDTSITVTHYASASMVNSTNAGVINISVNENNVVIYDINSVKKNYENDGYTCRIE